jgi:hypothetical protein
MPESVRRAGVGRRRSYGNELWDFDGNGLMRYREASINDVPIEEQDRLIFGPAPNPSGRASRCGNREAIPRQTISQASNIEARLASIDKENRNEWHDREHGERRHPAGVLDRWKAAVGAHNPERVASYFTEDTIFKGLHPYSVGREGISPSG